MNAKKLKPCPFCNMDAAVKEHNEIQAPATYFVGCNSCGSQSDIYMYPDEAIAVWNKRAYEEELSKLKNYLLQEIDELVMLADMASFNAEHAETEEEAGEFKIKWFDFVVKKAKLEELMK